MTKAIAVVVVAVSLAGVATFAAFAGRTPASGNDCVTYNPQIPAPSHFVGAIDNPYFPLPVGRRLKYRGIEDGQREVDRVSVTDRTKVIEGITATVVLDEVLEQGGRLLEKTFDWYAQDDQGNVWYLGEDTKEYLPNGKVNTSGSWEAGVNGAKPGVIMEADPQVPDGYRQECLSGEAVDIAWVVSTGGSIKVPYGTVHRVLRSLEFSPLEPNIISEKRYGPGLGILSERDLHGGQETFELVRVSG
jgi:hypothetical protein